MPFWDDPVSKQLALLLDELEAGIPPSQVEHRYVDVKEEPGRRGTGGVILPGEERNEAAATYLCGEVACMASSPHGGAIVLGVADRGGVIGTELNAEWLRHRLWEKLQRKVTVEINEASVQGTRVLVLKVPSALEPIVWEGRLRWRVDDNCVEIDSGSWWAQRNHRLGHDWAAERSNFDGTEARPVALEIARKYLRASGEEAARDLADASDADLLRRLNASDGDGTLTRAAAILFVGTGDLAIDYIRREVPGGDSQIRLNAAKLSLLEEIQNVEQAIAASNKTTHLDTGNGDHEGSAFVRGQLQELPALTVREAIVNAVAHRDWRTSDPVTVEHVGASLVVSSPGGFVPGVTPHNILTHPSAPRYKALADLFAALRIAEREGVGVDRMYRDMVSAGYQVPVIAEHDGPRVRVALLGGKPDVEWVTFLAALQPSAVVRSVDAVLALNSVAERGWIDAASVAPILQRSTEESRFVINQLLDATIDGAPVLQVVEGVPDVGEAAYRPSDGMRRRLKDRAAKIARTGHRARLALEYAKHRGRISTTELGSLVGINPGKTLPTLNSLEADGELMPGRENRRGRGFFYRPAQ